VIKFTQANLSIGKKKALPKGDLERLISPLGGFRRDNGHGRCLGKKEKKMKKGMVATLVLAAAALLLGSSLQAWGCCTILVGKDASVDGSTIVTIQQDTPSYDPRLFLIPAKDHPPGAMRLCPDYPQYQRWWDVYGNPRNADEIYMPYDHHPEYEVKMLEIPQVPHTYAYMSATFSVMNEHQVSFGMPTLGPRDELACENGRIRLTQLTFIAAERAKTAREAIRIMGSLAEKYGFVSEYTPGKSLGVGDPNEVWFFNIIEPGPFWTPDSGKPGAIWVAQRVPDDHVAWFPNEMAIGEIDFDDPDNFMYCDHVKSFAVEMGWWPEDAKRPFHFRHAYKGKGKSWMSTLTRKWSGFRYIVPSLGVPDPFDILEMVDEYGYPKFYPFSVKPDKKVPLELVFRMTRDRLEGTKYDLHKGPLAGPYGTPQWTFPSLSLAGEHVENFGSISNNSTQFTEVCQMRNWLPDHIGGIVWWGPGRAPTAPKVPFYAGIKGLPETHTKGNHYNMEWGETAWWAATFIQSFANAMHHYIIQDVRKEISEIENEAFAAIPGIDRAALELYRSDPEKGRDFLTQWCGQFARDVTERYWDFAEYLIVKYHNQFINKPKVSQKPKIPDEEYWTKIALEYQKEVRGLKK